MKKVFLIIMFFVFLAGCIPRTIDCNRYIDPENRAACLKGLEELRAEIKEAEKREAYEYGRGRNIYAYPYDYYRGRSCYNYSESRYKKGKSSYYNYSYCY